MAFPGTYNISYYKGDTYEFRIYPKISNGTLFDLTDYFVVFTMANKRGTAEDVVQVAGFTEKQPDGSVLCTITPTAGQQISTGWVYDIEVYNPQDPGDDYPLVYTLLTGSITVTEQVTITPGITVDLPEAPTDLTITESPAGTVNVSWTAPATGDPATSYKIYGKAPLLGVADYLLITATGDTEYSANAVFGVPFQSGVQYFIKVTSVNAAGENTTDFAEGSVTIG
jgi:hypothetical protein